ncbi:hypothetical protein AAG639_32445, partial [Pseudomonas aeruginosa]
MSAQISSGGQTPSERSSTAASLDRRIQMLRTAMGPVIAAALADQDVVEIMPNPDRTLWAVPYTLLRAHATDVLISYAVFCP